MKIFAPEYFDAMLLLIRRGLSAGCKSSDGAVMFRVFDYQQWRLIFEMAALHGVVGIAVDGSYGLNTPMQTIVDLAPYLGKIESGNSATIKLGKKLSEVFTTEGLHPLIYKGISLFDYYPCPIHRSPGDIDIWFAPEEFGPATKVMKNMGAILVNENYGCVGSVIDGISVEFHRLYFDCQRQDIVKPGSQQGELLMLAAHILKHFIGNGVQLKHICDYAMARKANGDIDAVIAREAGLKKWVTLLNSFVDYHLLGTGSEQDAAICSPLYKRLRSYRRDIDNESRFTTILNHLSSLPFALKYAPGFWLFTIKTLVSDSKKSSRGGVAETFARERQ